MLRRVFLIVMIVLSLGASVVAQNCSIWCYFVSPGADHVIETAIIQAINGVKRTLDIAMYSFTDDQLGDVVVRASRRGVNVRVILDGRQKTAWGGEYEKLVSAGISVLVARVTAQLHHKFVVIDENLVITGSYDWSDSSAKETYDNAVFIECPVLTAGLTIPQQYAREFDRLWEQFGGTSGGASEEPASGIGASSVIIDEVDRIGECIQLLNVSPAALDLTGWSLSDLEGRYTFPANTRLVPNEPYRVCIDTYNPMHDPHGFYLEDHDEVFLVTPEGVIVDEVVW